MVQRIFPADFLYFAAISMLQMSTISNVPPSLATMVSVDLLRPIGRVLKRVYASLNVEWCL